MSLSILGAQGRSFQAVKPHKPALKQSTLPLTSPVPPQTVDFQSLNKLGSLNFVSFMASKQINMPTEWPNIKISAYKKLSPQTAQEIRDVSSVKINTKPHWNIEKPRVWMVSSETSTFMKTGGLGEVAVELPNAFNKAFRKNGCSMSIVQPLYRCPGIVDLKAVGDGSFIYENKILKNSIHLKPTGERLEVPAGVYKKEMVDVLKGTLDGTDYIFLKNDDYFGTIPVKKGSPSPYGVNERNVGESERFAFFSKAVGHYLKDLVEKESPDAPNVIDLNDWHAGPLAAQLNYLFPAKASLNDGISKEIAEKIQDIPLVYTVHNLAYQGWDYENTSNILNTLYEGYATEIFNNAKVPHMQDSLENCYTPSPSTQPRSVIVRDTYNAAMHGLALADAVVTVSPNYSKEIASNNHFGYDFKELLGKRREQGNLVGIVNGIGNDAISPDGSFAQKVSTVFPELKLYSKTPGSIDDMKDILKTRLDNKKAFVKLLQSGEVKKRTGMEAVNDYDLSFLKEEDVAKTPFLSVVSRIADQKGIDILANSIKHVLTEPIEPGKPLPVVLLLGNGDKEQEDILKDLINKYLPKEKAERVLFFNQFGTDLKHVLQVVGDVFLMPSKFEPCGLGQLEAMAKGCIPVATATGGLADTIEHGKTGFLSQYSPDKPEKSMENYNKALDLALKVFYNQKNKFNGISMNALKKDFGWQESGSLDKYLQLFQTGSPLSPKEDINA